MAEDKFPEFTEPHIDYTQLDLTAAGGATPQLQINPDDFRVEQDVVVERFIISSYDSALAAAPGPAFTTYLPRVNMIWWDYRRLRPASGPMRPVPCYDTAVYERTSYLGSAVGQLSFRVGWKLTHRVRVGDGLSMTGFWTNPLIVAAAGFPAGTIFVTLHGLGAKSGEHRTIHAPVAFTASAGGGANGPGAIFGPGALAQGTNNYGEDILVDQVLVHTDTDSYPFRDSRLFNHLRLSVWTGSGKEWSIGGLDFTYPLFAYGAHRNFDGLVTIFEPENGPILYPKNEGTGFEFQNLNAQALRMQVARIGRMRPT